LLRSADLLHVHGEVAAGLALPALATRRSVVTPHGLHLLRRSRGAVLQAAALNLRLLVRAATRTICVSVAERDEMSQSVGERLAGRLVVVHNGVPLPSLPADSARENARMELELELEPSVVAGAYLGSLDPHKEVLTAARAAVEAHGAGSPVALLVAGDG